MRTITRGILLASQIRETFSQASCTGTCDYKDGTVLTNELDQVYWVSSSNPLIINGSDGAINVGGEDNWDAALCCASQTQYYISRYAEPEWPRNRLPTADEYSPGPRLGFEFEAYFDYIGYNSLVVLTHENADDDYIYGSTYFMLSRNDQEDEAVILDRLPAMKKSFCNWFYSNPESIVWQAQTVYSTWHGTIDISIAEED